jgi:eukaryotic-like serine/threonine-protein kinase
VKVAAGTIQILSTPDVTITRNGVELGRTPITITLPVGRNELQVSNRAEGLARTMNLEILDDKNESVRWSKVSVNAPQGTRVAVDGRTVGKTPLQEIPLWPGTHTLDITFPKGDKEQKKVQIEAGTTQAVYFEAPVHDVDVSQ